MTEPQKSANQIKVIPVILCGGIGSRLWPLSRESYPKQFLSLTGELSLFQQTLKRLTPLLHCLNVAAKSLATEPFIIGTPIVVTNETHRFIVLDQLHQISQPAEIILEPVGKNTAPSLTLAALQAKESDQDAILIVLPADHAIHNSDLFCQSLSMAINQVVLDTRSIVTLGVTPTHSETGYGYIQCDSAMPTDDNGNNNIYNVNQFVEKPDLDLAREYIESGNYYWNSGIFVVASNTWLKAINTFAEPLYQATYLTWQSRKFDTPFIRPDQKLFAAIPADSIDYAVIEHCPNEQYYLAMVKLLSDWSDLGSWQSVSEQQIKDTDGNAQSGDVLLINSRNCYIHAQQRLVSLLGVEDLIVVDTADALLIAHKSQSQAVKDIVSQLKSHNRSEAIGHRKVYRPWGWYDSIDECDRFKVKRICVNPKASLSLQKHHHRAEHWVVVKGTAEVTCGDKAMLLSENQSTYIPLGVTHRLCNPGNIPLEIIEVQSGSYLGEDDIVRLQDDYGRG